VTFYDNERERQSIDARPPAQRFSGAASPARIHPTHTKADRSGDQWVSRKVCANGIVCAWQQVCVGRHRR